MDRRDWYFKQPVTEEELNDAFDCIENALWRLMTDWGLVGVATGMVGAQISPTPSMRITISGPGYAYDASGERIYVAAPFEPAGGLDLTIDSNLVPTAVGAGHERWISVYVQFTRDSSDPRIDGSSNSIFFKSNESHKFVVVQGVEAPVSTAPRPTIDPAHGVLLFDVHRTNGQITILNTDIDTTRRQDTFVVSQSPVSLRAGNLYGGVAAMLQALNNHILGSIGPHPDTGITSPARGGSPLALPFGHVSDQLLAIQTYIDGALQTALGGIGATVADSAVTSIARAGSPLALPLGHVSDQLDAIRAYIDGGLQTALAYPQGQYKVAYRFNVNSGAVSSSPVDWAAATMTAGSSVNILKFMPGGTVSAAWTFTGPFLAGDIFDIEVNTTLGSVSAHTVLMLGEYGAIAGSDVLAYAGIQGPITLRGQFLNSTLNATMGFFIAATPLTGPGDTTISLHGGFNIVFTVYRPTP
jgi:hypothetical protein